MSVQQMEFKTEVKELLDLMIHSLYSHKEVFLRELISNASDAIDKARYESLTDGSILEDAGEWKIRVVADKDAKTLTLSDNGIGMTRDEIIEALGTIAHSGTKDFLAALQSKEMRDKPELIGQFGVGFYSAFMVADRVTVVSRKAGHKGKKAVKWESGADGSYTVEDVEKETPGTEVVLYLKDEEKKYLDEWEIRNIIKKYSDYIEHPVVMEIERERESELEKGTKIKVREEETLNTRKAIWLRDKSEVTGDEYSEFYRHVSHDFGDPAKVIHYKAEGTSEFTALLYIPSTAPMGILFKEYKVGPALYVKRVQIMDHCEELVPPYLRFVKGVVDSSDLPLNVSREMLQSNRQVEIIKKNITKKVLDTLGDMKKDEYEKYLSFYREFGKIVKEGIHYDFSRKEQLADLLLFQSTKTADGSLTTFEAYLDAMKPGQEEIYYITAATREEALQSPYLEAFSGKDYEVLIMLDEIDDFIMGNLFEYKGKKLKSVIRGAVDLDKTEASEKEKAKEKFQKLLDFMKERLKDDIKEVRLSGRLRDSACCLVTDEGGMDPKMESMLRAMGQDIPASKRILEINPSHPIFEAMNTILATDERASALQEYTDVLYNEALILEGSKPKDPARFARVISRLIVENTKKSDS